MGRDRVDMAFHIHSHPGGDFSKRASGYDLYNNGLSNGSSDANFMSAQFNLAKDAGKAWPGGYPKLFIYHKESKGLYNYNHKSSSIYVGGVTSSSSMKGLVQKYKLRP